MSEPRRILIVKLADFGDALLTTPAIRSLRIRYPGAVVDALTTPQSATVFRHSGLVDDVIVFRKEAYDRLTSGAWSPVAPLRLVRALRARRYDAVALMHVLSTRGGSLKHAALTLATGAPRRAGIVRPGSRRGWFLNLRAPDAGFDRAHTVASCLAVAGALGAAPPDDLTVAFVPGPEAESAARALLTDLPPGDGPVVAIHPGSGAYSVARRWPAASFAAVIDALTGTGCRIVLVGTPADGTAEVRRSTDAPLLDLTGRTDLPVLASVLRAARLLVGNDSGVTHLATAVGTRVVAVFGPSNPVAWGPWWPNPPSTAGEGSGSSPHRVIALDVPCRPCFYVGHDLGSPNGCPTRDCLTWLGPGTVIAAALDALG